MQLVTIRYKTVRTVEVAIHLILLPAMELAVGPIPTANSFEGHCTILLAKIKDVCRAFIPAIQIRVRPPTT